MDKNRGGREGEERKNEKLETTIFKLLPEKHKNSLLETSTEFPFDSATMAR